MSLRTRSLRWSGPHCVYPLIDSVPDHGNVVNRIVELHGARCVTRKLKSPCNSVLYCRRWNASALSPIKSVSGIFSTIHRTRAVRPGRYFDRRPAATRWGRCRNVTRSDGLAWPGGRFRRSSRHLAWSSARTTSRATASRANACRPA
jgi:hypothetical protein